MPKFIDLTGQVVHGCTVLHRVTNHTYKTDQAIWLVRCNNCGSERMAQSQNIRLGRAINCHNCTHNGLGIDGRSKTLEYGSWKSLKDRCDNMKNKKYHNYGGRGITYDPTWKDFNKFLQDMGPKPTPNHSIDRIDPNGNYCKSNCRWATRLEQEQTKRKPSYIDITGQVFNYLTVLKPAKTEKGEFKWLCKCECGTLTYVRPYKLKSGHTKSCGCLQKARLVLYKGIPYTTKDLSQVVNVSRNTLDKRRSKGWSDKEIIFGRKKKNA